MNSTAPKPFVFVLMPFAQSFDDGYKLGIKASVEECGAYCERVDEQVFEGTVLERIYNQIATAEIIVADMTGRNPNVFYEVGYAHALNKSVVLLTQNADDIPFDLKSYPHIVYTSIVQLKAELSRKLAWLIAHPKDKATLLQFPVRYFYHGKPVLDAMDLELMRADSGEVVNHYAKLQLDIFNSPERLALPVTFRFGIVTHREVYSLDFQTSEWGSATLSSSYFAQSDGTTLALCDQEFSLLPGAWQKLWIGITTVGKAPLEVGEIFITTFRVLHETGVHDTVTRWKLV